MNIAEILKNVPEGTKLYSTLFGYVELLEINNDLPHPIRVKLCDTDMLESFTKEGKYNNEYPNGECILFPSKENRDWSKFKVEKSYEFKPFDKVLVRDDNDEYWMTNIFSHFDIKHHKYRCIWGYWSQCIPYEGNEHVLGTKACLVKPTE